MGSQFGSFELLRRLGAGATAEVFLASGPNAAAADLVALKIVLPHLSEDAALRESLLKEARLCERIQHRHVARIYGVGEANGRPYLAMEYVRGWTVSHVLKKLREAGERFELDEACSMARDAALGLHHAHELLSESGKSLGLIHRDVSPQNMILGHDGRVKVVDFGLAKATQTIGEATGAMKGKIAYMPPEQIQGGKLDRRVDVFALGAVLFELITGERLYPGKNEAEILQQAVIRPPPDVRRALPKVPAAVVETIEKAIARDLKDRIPNALVFAHALKGAVTTETTSKLARRVERLFDPDAAEAPAARPVVEAEGADRTEVDVKSIRASREAKDERPRVSGEKRRPQEERDREAEKGRSSDERSRKSEDPDKGRSGEERARKADEADKGRGRKSDEADKGRSGDERGRKSEDRPRMSGEKGRPGEDKPSVSGEKRRVTDSPSPSSRPRPSRERASEPDAAEEPKGRARAEPARALEPLPRELQRAGMRPPSMQSASEPEFTSGGEQRWGDATAARVLLSRPGRTGLRRLGMALFAVVLTLVLGGFAILVLTRIKPAEKGPGALAPAQPEEPTAEQPVPGAMQPLGPRKDRSKKSRPREVEIVPSPPADGTPAQ